MRGYVIIGLAITGIAAHVLALHLAEIGAERGPLGAVRGLAYAVWLIAPFMAVLVATARRRRHEEEA